MENAYYFVLGSTNTAGWAISYIIVRVPVNDISFLTLHASVVNIGVPLLLELDVLKKAKLILDFSVDELRSRCDNWSKPLILRLGHVHVECPMKIYFKETELRKVYRLLYDPTPGKFYHLHSRPVLHSA